MADVPSPEGSPSRLRRDPSFSLGGNIDAFYKGASAAIAAAFVLTLVVLSERSYVGCGAPGVTCSRGERGWRAREGWEGGRGCERGTLSRGV